MRCGTVCDKFKRISLTSILCIVDLIICIGFLGMYFSGEFDVIKNRNQEMGLALFNAVVDVFVIITAWFKNTQCCNKTWIFVSGFITFVGFICLVAFTIKNSYSVYFFFFATGILVAAKAPMAVILYKKSLKKSRQQNIEENIAEDGLPAYNSRTVHLKNRPKSLDESSDNSSDCDEDN